LQLLKLQDYDCKTTYFLEGISKISPIKFLQPISQAVPFLLLNQCLNHNHEEKSSYNAWYLNQLVS
jgi:hypothetical protein